MIEKFIHTFDKLFILFLVVHVTSIWSLMKILILIRRSKGLVTWSHHVEDWKVRFTWWWTHNTPFFKQVRFYLSSLNLLFIEKFYKLSKSWWRIIICCFCRPKCIDNNISSLNHLHNFFCFLFWLRAIR